MATSKNLPLRELESLPSPRLAVLLALFHARVARQKACLLEYSTQFWVVLQQGARDAVLGGTRLSVHSTAVNIDQNVELGQRVGSLKRLLHQHPVEFIKEVRLKRLVVNGDIACSRSQEHAGRRSFSSARSIVLN